jgi:uncharacterized ion transporter superfamily protein YfcC
MEEKAGAQISVKIFIQSMVILFALMMVAGILTRTVPTGSYTRILQDGRQVVQPGSFQLTPRPDYPIWRWFTAPVEVLWGPDGLTIITILVFILMIGASFAILDKTGILKAAIGRIVKTFGSRKYWLLLAISLFFMGMGAFFGLFEEIVPLVPIMLALSYLLGWDSLVGLGMSILATNLGFSTAITNPFTIGVAQKLAGLPLFSGAGLRIISFIVVYALFAYFITSYARRIEKNPEASLVYKEDKSARERYTNGSFKEFDEGDPRKLRAMNWFLVFVGLILLVLLIGPFIPVISSFALPLVGVLFLVGGIGAGVASGSSTRESLKAAWEGMGGIAPGIPMILMASSIKYISAQGGIMDTILNQAATAIQGLNPIAASILMFFLTLFFEFFISGGSAKAFLMMPILAPLADLVGVTRQVTVSAYCFGDGFTNLAYPTNPVLLIVLGLTVVSYPKWMRWTAKMWLWLLGVTLIFLAIGVLIHYGPF